MESGCSVSGCCLCCVFLLRVIAAADSMYVCLYVCVGGGPSNEEAAG